MNKIVCAAILFTLLTGCRSTHQSEMIVSMQTIDRNGFSETISNRDRLKTYQTVNFLSSQPYEKVLRVYGKNGEGKSPSKLTSYHTNGSNWQYLEAVDGRANGKYLEWHENGKLKIQARVIEGLADLSETAQKSWLFDGDCEVWDDDGNMQAHFTYSRGNLEGEALYYHRNGNIERSITYLHGLINGTLFLYDPEGNLLGEIPFVNGVKDGQATANWASGQSKYQEEYREGLLTNATYFDPAGEVVAEIEQGKGSRASFEKENLSSLSDYVEGRQEGWVKLFSPRGQLITKHQIHEGMKHGEEWQYYLTTSDEPLPQLYLTWHEDKIQGMVKTWYENGQLESQREMNGNLKHGLSFAYYLSGDLMIMEEYENDRLVRGSYYRRGESTALSTIENGDGTATLFSPEGNLLKKVTYERGRPIAD